VDVVTNINIDVFDIARHLGMKFHFLIGKELPRD
jgi:hypothetical protein